MNVWHAPSPPYFTTYASSEGARNGEQYLLGACVGESVTLHEVAVAARSTYARPQTLPEGLGWQDDARRDETFTVATDFITACTIRSALPWQRNIGRAARYLVITPLSQGCWLSVSLGSGKAAPQPNRDTELPDPLRRSRQSYNSSSTVEPLVERNGSEVAVHFQRS